jgi:hypothetical protein
MADIRTVFPILADSSTGAGEPAISRIEGEAAAAQEGLIGFSFKDSSGNVVLPQLTSAGALPVDTEGVNFTCLDAYGEDAAPVVDTETDLATITLTDATVYNAIWVLVTSSRWSLYRVYWVDDVGGADTESDIGYIHVGPGQFSFCCEMPCKEFTSGTTSELRVAGTAKNQSSTLRASMSVREIA